MKRRSYNVLLQLTKERRNSSLMRSLRGQIIKQIQCYLLLTKCEKKKQKLLTFFSTKTNGALEILFITLSNNHFFKQSAPGLLD